MVQVKYEKVLEKLKTYVNKRNKEECAADIQIFIENQVKIKETKD